MQHFWLEIKSVVRDVLPYALLVTLGWMFIQQQERIVTDRLERLEQQLTEQGHVLNSVRDSLRDSGLAVPPFRQGAISDD